MGLKEEALRSLHLMVAGRWEAIPGGLLSYLEETLGFHPSEDPVGTAFLLIGLGVSPERAIALLNWRDFEVLCERGLQISGFSTRRGVRFSFGGRRYEVDVLAVDSDLALVIDCKMWSKGGTPRASKILEAAEHQLERAIALKGAIERGLVPELGTEPGRGSMVPCVVTWLDFGTRLSKSGVPVIPVSKLPSFLNDLREMLDEIRVIDTDFRIQIGRGASSQPRLPL